MMKYKGYAAGPIDIDPEDKTFPGTVAGLRDGFHFEGRTATELERAPWGRVVAIVAAILCLLKFPFGTAMGIWTLIVLLGYRNSTLYEQL